MPMASNAALLTLRDQVIGVEGAPIKVGRLQCLLALPAVRVMTFVNRIISSTIVTARCLMPIIAVAYQVIILYTMRAILR